jgi:hypothetical protein
LNTIDTTTLLDQISVIRVQLDELEREIRESLPKEEEKPPVVSMAQVRSLTAEKWSQGKRDELRAVLAKYGAKKLSDVGAEFYAQLADDVNKL